MGKFSYGSICPSAGLAAVLSLACVTAAMAQNFGGAFEGMKDNKKPIQIEADRLEVEDSKGMAFFEGNVSVVQGSTILKAGNLRVFYISEDEGSANSGPNGNIEKIIAEGKVAVRSGNQLATATSAVFDMKNQTVHLKGNVSVSQGNNIVTGCSLKINIKTSAAKLEPCKKAGGRVKMLFTPGSASQ